MCLTYGYCRVSTKKQKIERQIKNITKYCPDAILKTEAFTGTTLQRPVFEKLLKQLKPGDTVIFDSVSRMSRNSEEGIKLYFDLYEKGINLVFLKEHYIDTDTYKQALEKNAQSQHVNLEDNATDKLVNTILDALNEFQKDLAKQQIKIAFDQAQKEVDDLHGRIMEGLNLTDKASGRTTGQKIETKKSKENKDRIKKMCKDFGGSMTDKEVYETLNICRNTYFKYKREIKENILIS